MKRQRRHLARWPRCWRVFIFADFLGHGTEDRVVAADGGTVLVVLGFGVAHVVELRLKGEKKMIFSFYANCL